MAEITQSEFARLVDVNRATVHKVIKRGRLSLNDQGCIEVQTDDDSPNGLELAALELWEVTGSWLPHHRARMAQIREQKAMRKAMQEAAENQADPEAAKLAQDGMEALNLRLKRAETEKREHEADKARMEREQMAKNLVRADAVEYGLRDFTQRLGAMFDNAPDQHAAEMHALQSVEEVRANIAAMCDGFRHAMADAMATAVRLAREEEEGA